MRLSEAAPCGGVDLMEERDFPVLVTERAPLDSYVGVALAEVLGQDWKRFERDMSAARRTCDELVQELTSMGTDVDAHAGGVQNVIEQGFDVPLVASLTLRERGTLRLAPPQASEPHHVTPLVGALLSLVIDRHLKTLSKSRNHRPAPTPVT
jgi:hypothetical protein